VFVAPGRERPVSLLAIVSPLLLFSAVRRGLLLLVFRRVLQQRLLLKTDVASFIP
jgi:hypothetical protein